MRLKLEGGIVISMDPEVGDLRRGDVLIEDGKIVEVAPVVEAADVELLDARGMVVLPGLVDPHRHLWYAPQRAIAFESVHKSFMEVLWPKLAPLIEPAELYLSTRTAIADALNSGITSVLDWCHLINSDEHAEQAIQAHLDSEIRAVFGFGSSMKRKLEAAAGEATGYSDWEHARRVHEEVFERESRLDLALAISGPQISTAEEAASDIAVARSVGLPVTTHVGTPQGTPTGAVRRLAEKVELGPDIQFVHCCGTEDDELDLIAAAGSTVACCPMAEASIGLGTPATGRIRSRGIAPAFGCDSVTGSNGDLFDEARCGLLIERALNARVRFGQGEAVTDPAQLGLSSREALEAITVNAARSIWLEDRVGSLTPGKRADVAMLRAKDLNLAPLSNVVETVVSSANAFNVDTVLVDGRVVKRDGALVDTDLSVLVSEFESCRDNIFERAQFEGMLPKLPPG